MAFVLSTAVLFTSCKNREQTLSQETAYEDAQINALMNKIKKVSRSFSQRVHKRISKI